MSSPEDTLPLPSQSSPLQSSPQGFFTLRRVGIVLALIALLYASVMCIYSSIALVREVDVLPHTKFVMHVIAVISGCLELVMGWTLFFGALRRKPRLLLVFLYAGAFDLTFYVVQIILGFILRVEIGVAYMFGFAIVLYLWIFVHRLYQRMSSRQQIYQPIPDSPADEA